MDISQVVRDYIEREQLLEPGATIVVGVSGGADSLCLLHVLSGLRTEYDWLIHIGHLHHCLRGADADDDMLFVATLALDWGLPCTIEVVDVRTVAQRMRLSLEETARQVRYGFLGALARRVDAACVAVGHNADDQSETVLLHFLRGAGLAGLRGMSPSVDLESLRVIRDDSVRRPPDSQIRLVRPLLSVPRAEIERYCQAHSLSPRFDSSNLDTTFSRNRLRHHLLPLLETYNPKIRALLRRTAEVAAADHELLTHVRNETWDQIVTEESEHAVSFDLARWNALPLALQRATLRQAAFRLCPELRDVEFVHIQQAVDIANRGSTGMQTNLPQGLRLTVGYRNLQMAVATATPTAPDWPLLWQDIPVPVVMPGQTALLDGERRPSLRSKRRPGRVTRWWLEARPWNGDRATILNNPDRWTAYFDADKLGSQLALRRRKAGDRFQPLGMGGHSVEVADFMIKAKIPRRWRTYIPLLVYERPNNTQNQELAWIVGWRIDERVKITAETRHMVRLRWLRSQNPVTH